MGSSNESIVKTLLYSDIFDYPLSRDEIWKFLISSNKIDKQIFLKYLNLKNKLFYCKDNFYFIKGREKIVKKRQEKERFSLDKINFAKKIIKKISFIPSINFIGISGALAMKNSDKNDDIDLFVITSKNSVWITRLLIICTLIILKVYRKRNEKDVSNKICLNMIIDDSALSFSNDRKDLYSAHEIIQIIPIFNKNNTYEKFINSNIWIKNFLPNALSQKSENEFVLKISLIEKIINFVFANLIIEFFAKNIQLLYMKKHVTNETISSNFLAFHPFNYKRFVLNLYKKKISKYGYSISY